MWHFFHFHFQTQTPVSKTAGPPLPPTPPVSIHRVPLVPAPPLLSATPQPLSMTHHLTMTHRPRIISPTMRGIGQGTVNTARSFGDHSLAHLVSLGNTDETNWALSLQFTVIKSRDKCTEPFFSINRPFLSLGSFFTTV